MSTKKIKSVIPIYVIGACALVYALFFPLYAVWHYIIMAGIAALGFYAARIVFPGKFVEAPATDFARTGDKNANAALAAGKAFIENMYISKKEISNAAFKRQLEEIISDSEKIFDFVSKTPESLKLIRSFVDYYLPQTDKIIATYIELSKLGSSGKSIQGTIGKIEETMPTIVEAFSTQLDNLYKDKAFDIRTDIKVLEVILKSDGLGEK